MLSAFEEHHSFLLTSSKASAILYLFNTAAQPTTGSSDLNSVPSDELGRYGGRQRPGGPRLASAPRRIFCRLLLSYLPRSNCSR